MSTAPGGVRLGEILLAEAGLSRADLARGLAIARATSTRLGSVLVGLGLLDADTVATALARQHGVAAARDKHLTAIAPETVALLSPATARRLCAVPVGVMKGGSHELVIAMRDPGDAAAIAELARETAYNVRPAVACESRLREIVDQMLEAPVRARVQARVPVIELTPPPGPISLLETAPSALVDLTPEPGFMPELGFADEIDLAPETAPSPRVDLTPAPVQVRSYGPPPVVSMELELADVPRGRTTNPPPMMGAATTAPGRPIGMNPIPPVRTTAGAAAIGGAALDDRPRSLGLPPIVVQLVGVGVAVAIGWLTYQHFDGDDDALTAGAPVHGTFHDDRLDLTMRLPGAGWRDQPDGLGKLPQLGDGTRADVFLRGDNASRPESVAMIARISKPGAFPRQIESGQLRAGLDAAAARASTLSNGAFALSGLTCRVDALGALPLGVCDGAGTVFAQSYDIHFFMWIPTTDDALVTVWFDRAGGAAEARSLVESIKLD